MAYKGLRGHTNDTAILVSDYVTRRTLSKIGVRFKGEDLSCFESEYLVFIHNEWTRLDNEKRKRQQKLDANRSRKR